VNGTLAAMVGLAVSTIESCDCAGISLVDRGVVATLVHTDPMFDDLGAIEGTAGEGPSLDAIAGGLMIYADDLTEDARWPRFAPRASATGIRSALALPLGNSASFGALTLYAHYPAAFGAVDRAKAVILASLASLAVAAARSHEDDERRAENFHAALLTREVIGQAQGILMERERITAVQAFDILRRASQHFNRKLRDVAQDLVTTGERPQLPTAGLLGERRRKTDYPGDPPE
jgi:hypothetical protein